MADPWEGIPVVRSRNDSRQDEREKAETRYRNVTGDTNPLARPVILPGEEGYAGGGQYVPEAGVVVRPWESVPVLTDSQLRAEEIAAQRIGQGQALQSGGGALLQGLTSSFSDELGGLVAGAGQAVGNAYRTATGQPIEVNSADLRSAMTNQIRGEQERFAMERPVSNAVLQLAGGALTGGGAIGSGVRGAVTTGAAYGAGYGAGSAEGGFADRLPEAAAGGAVGGVLGGGAQVGINAVAPYAQRLAGIAGSATQPIREAGARMVGRGPEAGVVASRRLADQFRRRGLNEEQVAEEIARYRAAGLNPSVLDVGGDNVAATIRASAAAEGPGRQLAGDYRDRVASELAPRTIERTRRLTPDESRDSFTMAGDLTRSRNTAAREEYGPAYAEQVVVPDVALRSLRGNEGAAAMRQARRIAEVEQDFDTMEQIDALISADLDAAPVASGRALEYVRRAYADIAADAPDELAAGFRTRLDQIDAGLDEIPGLREARSNYRAASEQIDAAGGSPVRGRQVLGRPNRAPQSALTETGPRYAGYVDSLRDPVRPVNQVYQRDQLINRLAGAREGAVGPLNTITPGAGQPITPNSPYVAQNLERTFPGQGQQYQQDIALARDQMSQANFVDPNSGPKTAGVLTDQASEGIGATVDLANRMRGQTLLGTAASAISSLARRTGGLNEQERAAIVQLGLGSADDLQRIIQIADGSRAAGRPPPREVRAYIERARNTLGAQNPVAQQLEVLLLPSRVSAEEEQQ